MDSRVGSICELCRRTVDGGLSDLDGSVFGEVKVGSCACRGEDASLVPVDDVSGCPAVMREG